METFAWEWTSAAKVFSVPELSIDHFQNLFTRSSEETLAAEGALGEHCFSFKLIALFGAE